MKATLGFLQPAVLASGPAPSSSVSSLVPMRTLDAVTGYRLGGVARRVIDGAKNLVAFVDENRDLARRAGVETIAVELSGILAAGRLHSVLDAAEDASDGRLHISEEGMGYLSRSERLLAEANRSLVRVLGRPIMSEGSHGLGQARPSATAAPVAVLIGLGALGLGILLAVLLSRD